MRTLINCVVVLMICFNADLDAQVFSSEVNEPVPDDGQVYSFEIEVSGLPGTIDMAFGLERVCINFTHPYDEDIQISLEAPDGTMIDLSSNNGGGEDNFTNTCFTENAWLPINAGAPPYPGDYNPEGNLNDVNNGQDPNGTWTLVFYDTYWFADSGFLIDWALSFTSDLINPQPNPFDFDSSELPLVYINTDNNGIPDDPAIPAYMQVIDNGEGNLNHSDDPFTYSGWIDIETRGQSTQGFPKKSYGIEMKDDNGNDMDTTFLGMPADEDWVLYAPYSEKSLMQNWLAMSLGNEMGGYHSRTRYCEVFLNGMYQGIYLVMEKIKREGDRVDIARLDPDENSGDDLTGGYIWRVDWGNETGWNSEYPTPADPNNYPYYQFVYPRPEFVTIEQQEYLQAYVDSFEYALADTDFDYGGKRYNEYIDLQSYVDDFIMNEISKNVDGYRLSSYFYKDKDSNGGLMVNGPLWDFNLSFGNADYCDGSDTDEWMYQSCGNSGPFWWPRFMEDTVFTNALYCRWTNLRLNTLSEESLHNRIDAMAAHLDVAADRNFVRWPILGVYVWPNPNPLANTYAEAVDQLKSWISARLLWMDDHITGNPMCIPDLVNSSPNLEDFEGDVFPPACWTVENIGAGSWDGLDPVSGFESSHSAFSNSLTADDFSHFLITPQLSLQAGEHLTFYISAHGGTSEHFRIALSTDGNATSDFETILWEETISGSDWRYRAVDLEAWVGETIYIAFIHVESDGNLQFKLDDVQFPSYTDPGMDCLDEISENGIDAQVHIYPNPASDDVFISADNRILNIQLVDSFGKIVLSERCNSKTHRINISALSKGVYHVKAMMTEGVESSILLVK